MDWQPWPLRQDETEVTVAETKCWYLVCYDVRDDRRLRQVAKHLKGYGERIQLSVFRCRLNRRGIERLKWELTKMMHSDDDLLVIGLCADCASRITRGGAVLSWSEEIARFEVI